MRKTPISNYAYACTRVRARKKKLITHSEYAKMASMNLASMARHISETAYKDEVEALAPEMDGSELIETATYLNLASTYKKVTRFCQGEAKEILHHYLNELDLLNLKTVIRGKYHKAGNDEIYNDLIPGGAYTQHLEQTWRGANTVQELVMALEGSHFHHAMMKALERDPEMGSLVHIEDAIDRTHYAQLLEAMSGRGTGTGLFRDFIKREIDLRNLLTLLRVRMDSGSEDKWKPEDIFIPGGRELSQEKLTGLYSITDPKQLFTALEKYSFHEAMEPHVEETVRTGRLSGMIKSVEQHHRKRMGQFAKRYPLSILPIIHYLMLKRNEVANLRLIARGKAMGLKPDVIRGLIT